jgi:hypothetical protein
MKMTKPILGGLLAISLSLSGCQTSTQADKTAVAVVALQVATTTGAMMALKNNPKYVPAARAIISGLDKTLAGEVPITSELISTFIGQIGEKYGLKPDETAVFVTLATTVYEAYLAQYQPKIVLSSDPNAQKYIKAFRDGLAVSVAGFPG